MGDTLKWLRSRQKYHRTFGARETADWLGQAADEIEQRDRALNLWQKTGDAIMLAVCGREAPLSDSDVIGEFERLREALFESHALNVNWASDADEEMLQHLSEYRAVIAMAEQALAAAAEEGGDDEHAT